MTASIGVMAFDSRTGLTGLELVTEDDIAMYDAKWLSLDFRWWDWRPVGGPATLSRRRGSLAMLRARCR